MTSDAWALLRLGASGGVRTAARTRQIATSASRMLSNGTTADQHGPSSRVIPGIGATSDRGDAGVRGMTRDGARALRTTEATGLGCAM